MLEPNADAMVPVTTWAQNELQRAKQLYIKDDTQAEAVGNDIGNLVRKKDEAVASRGGWTQPLYSIAKRIEKAYQPFIKATDAAVEELQKRLLEYRGRVEAQKQAALPVALQLSQNLNTPQDVQLYQQVMAQGSIVVEKRVGAVVFAEKWRANVVNPTQVPAGVMIDGIWTLLWKVDETVLQQIADRKKHEAPIIPGIVFEKYEDVSQVRRS